MPGDQDLSFKGRLYVGSVVLAGVAAILHSAVTLFVHPVSDAWLILAALTLFSGSFTVKVPSIPATISVSETFVFTAILLFGTAPGTIIVAIDGLIISLWRRKRRIHRILFNGAEPAISIWIAATLFYSVSGVNPLSLDPGQNLPIARLLPPFLLLTAVYFLLNSWLTAVAVSLETGSRAGHVWRKHFFWLSLNYFGGASVAVLLARSVPGFESGQPKVILSALSVILPLLLISYLTFKTAMARVEDATHHLIELNTLYLSVIEALATTIDARDQITHGHIRRVQSYAVELARELGVRDPPLIQAIQAAALLHDLGKLRVPEHILNKPGKLTPGEFERVKTHSSVGAEILASIVFPYPVVPIVRHHHENWNGTGYPDGLSGTDIPIGARILAVVDCFDALTSDRPYRLRLSDSHAIRILFERRGEMYDPLVVDAFLRVHAEFGGRVLMTEGMANLRGARPSTESWTSKLPIETRLPPEGPDLPQLGVATPAQPESHHDLSAICLRLLRERTSASLVTIHAYRPESDDLVVAYASGSGSDLLLGKRVNMAQSISGWVAANRRAAVNADPDLEPMLKVSNLAPTAKSCLSLPLLSQDRLLGVITVYSTNADAFSERDLRVVEAIGQEIADVIGQTDAVSASKTAHSGPADGCVTTFIRMGHQAALVLLRIDADGDRGFGSLDSASIARALAVLTSVLRNTDLVFQHGSNELLLLLPLTGLATAGKIAHRISREVVSAFRADVKSQDATVAIRTGVAVLPDDGHSVAELILAARVRLAAATELNRTGVHGTVH